MEDATTSTSNIGDAVNTGVGNTIATATVGGDDANINLSTSFSNSIITEEVDYTEPHPAPRTKQTSSVAPLHDARHDDAASIASQEEERESSAAADQGAFGESVGTAVVGEDSDEDRGSSNIADSSAAKRGDSMLWPSEPSESVQGETYGDRFGERVVVSSHCSLPPCLLPVHPTRVGVGVS